MENKSFQNKGEGECKVRGVGEVGNAVGIHRRYIF